VKEEGANEQHKSIIGPLRAAATMWECEQINFAVSNRESVVESDFYTKLQKFDSQEGKKDKLFADHVTQVCEAHDRVIVSFLQQVQGLVRSSTEGLRENIGHNVHVYGDVKRSNRSKLGPSNDSRIRIVNSKTLPESERGTHILYHEFWICLEYIATGRQGKSPWSSTG